MSITNSSNKQIAEHKLFKSLPSNRNNGVHFHWCYQNFTSYHEHDFYEFVIITDGKMMHLHNNDTTLVSKGMFFVIKPGEYHQFSPVGNLSAKQINFSITPEVLDKLTSTFWNTDVLTKINANTLPDNVVLPPKTWDNVFNLVDQINQSTPNTQLVYVFLKTIILELSTCLLSKIEATETFEKDQVIPQWLTDFMETLNNPEVFTLKLKDIYPLAPYSQSMLNVYFNKYVGMTMITYVTRLKISYACNLLKYTDDSPLQISNKLAYDSLSHFNRIFKKFIGKSPIEYKKFANSTN